MSGDDFFALPAFNPADAAITLKRQLRELGLAERGDGFELKGQPVIALTVADTAIEARIAKRPVRSPEWTKHSLKSAADVRKFTDAVRQQLKRWTDDD